MRARTSSAFLSRLILFKPRLRGSSRMKMFRLSRRGHRKAHVGTRLIGPRGEDNSMMLETDVLFAHLKERDGSRIVRRQSSELSTPGGLRLSTRAESRSTS